MRFLYSGKIKAPFAQSLGFSASSYAVASSRRWNDLQSLQKSMQYFHSIYHISTPCNSSWLKIFSRGGLCPCSMIRIYGRITINMRESPASCGPYPHANSEALRRFIHASSDYRCRQRYGRHPSSVSDQCAKNQVNIIEVSQSILQEMFCMMMLVDVSHLRRALYRVCRKTGDDGQRDESFNPRYA